MTGGPSTFNGSGRGAPVVPGSARRAHTPTPGQPGHQGIRGMLHIHFGAGRLGLGLIAPFFQKTGSELYLLNRAVSGTNPTGSTGLSPQRRNELLQDHPERHYFIRKPAGDDSDRQVVRYDRFFEHGEDDVE